MTIVRCHEVVTSAQAVRGRITPAGARAVRKAYATRVVGNGSRTKVDATTGDGGRKQAVVQSSALALALAARVQEDLRLAGEVLGWAGTRRHTGVHEARKAIRRVRSLLAFGREAFDKHWRSIDRDLRRHNRALSALRDAHAVLEPARRLSRAADADARASWRQVLRWLRERRNRLLLRRLRSDPELRGYRDHLVELAAQAQELPWAAVTPDIVEQALRRSLARIERAGDAARRKPGPDTRHILRRRLRRLRMQVTALRGMSKADVEVDLRREARALLRRLREELPGRTELRRRSDELGWEQNLRVLDEALRNLDAAAVKSCRRQLRTALAEIR